MNIQKGIRVNKDTLPQEMQELKKKNKGLNKEITEPILEGQDISTY